MAENGWSGEKRANLGGGNGQVTEKKEEQPEDTKALGLEKLDYVGCKSSVRIPG